MRRSLSVHIGASILVAVSALGIQGAGASDAKPFRFDSPIGVVMRLYHDFSFQAVMDQNGVPYDDILNQPKTVLEKYFTETLIKLILADRRCAAAHGGLCNIDFSPCGPVRMRPASLCRYPRATNQTRSLQA
jgi:hypothetical protein